MDTVAIGCVNTLPNGMYSVLILDALSYQKGRFNNTAVTISSIVIINNTAMTGGSTSIISSVDTILIPSTIIHAYGNLNCVL